MNLADRVATSTLRCQLAVFDLDGTILDSHAAMEEAFRAAFAQARPGSEHVPFDELRRRQGRPFVDICEELGWPSTLPELFRLESQRRIGAVGLFPDAMAVLRFLADAGVPLAILTGKDRMRTEALLEHFDLAHFFSIVGCGDDPFAGKPSPEGLIHVIERIGVRPSEALYIGDSPIDERCAVDAGVPFAGVAWPEQPEQLRAGADLRLFRHGRDLIRFLEEW